MRLIALAVLLSASSGLFDDATDHAAYLEWCHTDAGSDMDLCECELAGAYYDEPYNTSETDYVGCATPETRRVFIGETE